MTEQDQPEEPPAEQEEKPEPKAKPEKKAAPVLAGWIILVFGLVAVATSSMELFFGGKFGGIFYGPLLFIAFFLAITGMFSGRLVSGLILLLSSVILPLAVWFYFDIACELVVQLKDTFLESRQNPAAGGLQKSSVQ